MGSNPIGGFGGRRDIADLSWLRGEPGEMAKTENRIKLHLACTECKEETYTTTKNGRQTHHHYFSAIIVESPLPLKPLYLRPESFFDKMAQFMGFDDINFESAELKLKESNLDEEQRREICFENAQRLLK